MDVVLAGCVSEFIWHAVIEQARGFDGELFLSKLYERETLRREVVLELGHADVLDWSCSREEISQLPVSQVLREILNVNS